MFKKYWKFFVIFWSVVLVGIIGVFVFFWLISAGKLRIYAYIRRIGESQ